MEQQLAIPQRALLGGVTLVRGRSQEQGQQGQHSQSEAGTGVLKHLRGSAMVSSRVSPRRLEALSPLQGKPLDH